MEVVKLFDRTPTYNFKMPGGKEPDYFEIEGEDWNDSGGSGALMKTGTALEWSCFCAKTPAIRRGMSKYVHLPKNENAIYTDESSTRKGKR